MHRGAVDWRQSVARSSQWRGASLLVDTDDVDATITTMIELAARLRRERIALGGVRLDSGDLGAQVQRVRPPLDAAGLLRHAGQMEELPTRLRALQPPTAPFQVELAASVRTFADDIDRASRTWPGGDELPCC